MSGFLTVMEAAQLRNACQRFGVPIPAAVPETDALEAEAEALLADVSAEVEPDPHTATAKTLRKVHAALVAWPSHDARLTHAQRLLNLARQRAIDSWARAAGDLLEGFRAPFTDAAKRYMAAHTESTDDPDAVADIAELARVRRILATVVPARMTANTGLAEQTLILTVPDLKTALRTIPVRLGGDGMPWTHAPETYSAAWLRILVAIPGVELRWNTPADQVALDARLSKSTNALGGV